MTDGAASPTFSIQESLAEPPASAEVAIVRGPGKGGGLRPGAVSRTIRAAGLILAALLGSTSWAGADFQTGAEAYRAKDYGRAAYEFRKSAEGGNAEASYRLGELYESGLGVPKDMAIAIDWYRKAAENGVVDAEVRLGEVYFYGTGVLQDFGKARRWFSKAATDNSAIAQRYLGQFYANGWGVEKSKVQAYVWYDYAAKNGDSVAESLRHALLKTMSADEIAEGERLARKMAPQILNQAPGNSGADGGTESILPTDGMAREKAAPANP